MITTHKLVVALPILLLTAVIHAAQDYGDYFKIIVVDEQTGRGVPLVELRTTSEVSYYTDSNGIIAFYEPGLMGSEVYFHVRSHGYEYPADGLGLRGLALKVTRGGQATIKLKRLNIAERLYRVTGEGIYRDSVLTGHLVPLRQPLLNGRVTGQDTVIVAPYRGRLYWFWGDTNKLSHPLGNFAASGAVSEMPGRGGLAPELGVDLKYFVDESGFAKAMCPFPSPGLKWIVGLMTVADETGQQRLLARYASMKDLGYAYEWGIAVFNEEKEVFEPLARFDQHDPHRSAHPFRALVNGQPYYYIFPNERVRADWKSLQDRNAYEAFTPLKAGTRYAKAASQLDRDERGRLGYAWKAATDPVHEDQQRELIKAGLMRPEEAWRNLRDIATGQQVEAGIGSVCWNEFRQRWVMITEKFGQVWYAEGDTPLGPWCYARRIVIHDRYTFYNPTQHPFFDQDGGRVIYFEGTYTAAFSGNGVKTPRYDYNQMMYRLRLDDERLVLPVPVYRVRGTSSYLLRAGVETWDEIAEVTFWAMDRPRAGLIPIFAATELGGTALRREQPSEASQPLFYTLPPTVAFTEAKLGGVWQCELKSNGGSGLSFTLELQLDGEQVSGRAAAGVIIGGTFRQGRLELRVKDSAHSYTLTARLRQGELHGEWQQHDTNEGGQWAGTRVDPWRQDDALAAIVPLYEYRRARDGARFYSTDPAWRANGLRRARQPLCRVWRNPAQALWLDRGVQAVPVR